MRIILSILIIFMLNGCTSTSRNKGLSQVVTDYFNIYSKREDFKTFMTYYADNAQFEDIIYGNRLTGKAEIKSFLDWNKGQFKTLYGADILTVTRHTIGKKVAVTEGFFHRFSYDGEKLGPWLFVITLEFDAKHKIIRQTDWINYTPRGNFLTGKNMNEELLTK